MVPLLRWVASAKLVTLWALEPSSTESEKTLVSSVFPLWHLTQRVSYVGVFINYELSLEN